MKIIKNQDSYSVTLSKKEVDNLIQLVDLYPMAWALSEIQFGLLEAKQEGESDNRLKNYNFIPPQDE